MTDGMIHQILDASLSTIARIRQNIQHMDRLMSSMKSVVLAVRLGLEVTNGPLSRLYLKPPDGRISRQNDR